MIVALMFSLGIVILMGLTELILFGIRHIEYWIERENDERKSDEKYQKYLSMFKYNP